MGRRPRRKLGGAKRAAGAKPAGARPGARKPPVGRPRLGVAKVRPGAMRKALEPYVEEAEAMAAAFVREAYERYGTELEYDLDHVRRLDRLCAGEREAFDDGLVLQAGFYLGEVLRRAYGGRYQWHAGRDALALEVGGLMAFPIETVRRAVRGEGGPTLEAYLMVLAKRLADRRERRDGPTGG